ncbi:MAG TPA: preQ(1) synthase [bacterium]|jgi:7-cyano-7-deazaguanine reductase
MPEPEGKTFEYEPESAIKPEYLEVFEFGDVEQHIKIETREFSAVCPFSGIPDYGYLCVEYYPEGGLCIELKSLKYYLVSFRNVGIYQEAATSRIYADLLEKLKTGKLQVTTVYNTRGGIDTTCVMGKLE